MARRVDSALALYHRLLELELGRPVPWSETVLHPSPLCRVQVVDPPWLFNDNGSRATAGYPKLRVSQIKQLPIPEIALPDSYLLLWCPSALFESAFEIARYWGFVPKSLVVWHKVGKSGKTCIGIGHHVRNAHEQALLATRGQITAKSPRNVPSIFCAPRTRHSAKPDEFYDLVERLSDGPYIDHFARRRRFGWFTVGNEVPPLRRIIRTG